jgi:hypothetical protein
MTIIAKVPTMSNEHLANLLDNARRMQASGTKPQQETAGAVVVAAEAEVATRRAAHLQALAAKRAAAPKKPSKKVKLAVE